MNDEDEPTPRRKKTETPTREQIQMEGVNAFRDKQPDSSCPYRSARDQLNGSQRRVWWMNGYWAAHVVANVPNTTLAEQLAETPKPVKPSIRPTKRGRR